MGFWSAAIQSVVWEYNETPMSFAISRKMELSYLRSHIFSIGCSLFRLQINKRRTIFGRAVFLARQLTAEILLLRRTGDLSLKFLMMKQMVEHMAARKNVRRAFSLSCDLCGRAKEDTVGGPESSVLLNRFWRAIPLDQPGPMPPRRYQWLLPPARLSLSCQHDFLAVGATTQNRGDKVSVYK